MTREEVLIKISEKENQVIAASRYLNEYLSNLSEGAITATEEMIERLNSEINSLKKRAGLVSALFILYNHFFASI